MNGDYKGTVEVDEMWDAWEKTVEVFTERVGEQALHIDLCFVGGRPVPDVNGKDDGRDLVHLGVCWGSCGPMSAMDAQEFANALSVATTMAACFPYNGYRVVKA